MEGYFNLGARAVFKSYGGATLQFLGKRAEELLHTNYQLYEDVSHIHPNFIYILGGLPDTTQKINDKNYQEIIYTEYTHDTIARVCNQYRHLSDYINQQLNAIPCFSTIATMSLHHWNHHRLNTGHTSYLIHYNHYDDMNHLLNEAILEINSYIRQLNESNNVLTPNFSSHIMKKRGQGRDHSVKYNRLTDGCHPTSHVQNKWQLELDAITSSNRKLFLFGHY